MIIQADNRGRIALSKLGIGKPHQDWKVEPVGDGRTVTLKKQDGENHSEWQKWGRLDPDLIGQVIYVDYESLHPSNVPIIREHADFTRPTGLAGVLEWFETGMLGTDVKTVKITGREPIEFKNFGLFWVKS